MDRIVIAADAEHHAHDVLEDVHRTAPQAVIEVVPFDGFVDVVAAALEDPEGRLVILEERTASEVDLAALVPALLGELWYSDAALASSAPESSGEVYALALTKGAALRLCRVEDVPATGEEVLPFWGAAASRCGLHVTHIEAGRRVLPAQDPDAAAARHLVVQELVFFSEKAGSLAWRVESHVLPTGVAPDAHVREVLGWGSDSVDGAALHSTSWRYVAGPEPALVLTWAVLPDPDPSRARVLPRDAKIARGGDAAHPVPKSLEQINVVRHAARHLAFLVGRDSTFVAALQGRDSLRQAFVSLEPDLAGNPGA